MTGADLVRELGKIREALTWAEQHLTHVDEANAALHCNPRVFYSPLTGAVHEAWQSLNRVLTDLATTPPSAAPPVTSSIALPPTPSRPMSRHGVPLPDQIGGRRPRRGQTVTVFGDSPEDRAALVRAGFGDDAWRNAAAFGMIGGGDRPAACPMEDPARCCVRSHERPLCTIALDAAGVAMTSAGGPF